MVTKRIAFDACPRVHTWVGRSDPGGGIALQSPFPLDGQQRLLCHPHPPGIYFWPHELHAPYGHRQQKLARWSILKPAATNRSATLISYKTVHPTKVSSLSVASKSASEKLKATATRSTTTGRSLQIHGDRRSCRTSITACAMPAWLRTYHGYFELDRHK